MKKFLEMYLGFFISLPVVFCITMYLTGCFITWSIPPINIEWEIVRVYMLFALVPSFFLSLDEK